MFPKFSSHFNSSSPLPLYNYGSEYLFSDHLNIGGYSGLIQAFFEFAADLFFIITCRDKYFWMMFARHLCTLESIHNFQLHSPPGAQGELFVNTKKDRNSPTNVGAIPVYQDFLVIEQMLESTITNILELLETKSRVVFSQIFSIQTRLAHHSPNFQTGSL